MCTREYFMCPICPCWIDHQQKLFSPGQKAPDCRLWPLHVQSWPAVITRLKSICSIISFWNMFFQGNFKGHAETKSMVWSLNWKSEFSWMSVKWVFGETMVDNLTLVYTIEHSSAAHGGWLRPIGWICWLKCMLSIGLVAVADVRWNHGRTLPSALSPRFAKPMWSIKRKKDNDKNANPIQEQSL